MVMKGIVVQERSTQPIRTRIILAKTVFPSVYRPKCMATTQTIRLWSSIDTNLRLTLTTAYFRILISG